VSVEILDRERKSDKGTIITDGAESGYSTKWTFPGRIGSDHKGQRAVHLEIERSM
jgi:hypothetical protein